MKTSNERTTSVLILVTAGLALCGLVGCGDSNGSTIGKLRREANLPLYFSVSGTQPGQGAIYRVDTLEPEALSEPELVVSGLDFPTGIAMDSAGRLYVAEKLPAPDGKVKVIDPREKTAKVFAEGLDNPLSIAVDLFNRIYVTEGDENRIQKTDARGELKPFVDAELTAPRDVFVDDFDNLYVTETDGGVVSRVDPHGKREVIAEGLGNPYGLTADAAGQIYVIANHTGTNDGEILRMKDDGTTEVVTNGLFNLIALTSDHANGLFMIEGEPANRIISYSLKTRELKVIAETPVNPYAVILTPH